MAASPRLAPIASCLPAARSIRRLPARNGSSRRGPMADKRAPLDPLRSVGPGPGRHQAGFTGARAGDARGAFQRLWSYLRPYGRGLLGALALVTVTTALALLNPYLISQAVDHGIIARQPGTLARILGLMALLHLVSAATTWLQTITMIGISQSTVRDLRADLFAKLQTLPLRFFDRQPHGELMSRLTNDTEMVSSTLGENVTQLMASTLSVVGAATAMLTLNWRLAIASVLTLPLVMLVTRLLARATRQGFRDRQRELGELNGLVEETISGQRAIKVTRHEPAAIAAFDAANARLRATGVRAGIVVGLLGPVMQCLRNSGFALLAGIGGWLVIKGHATVGMVAAFLGYAQQFSRPINEIASLYGMVQSALAGAERVFAILDEAPDQDGAGAPLTNIRGEVVFDQVSFGYEPGQPVLREVSFTAAPGETIALVGQTGAGKTTIINLLTRFYDVDQGSIKVDGRDLRELPKTSLRQALGIVLQDTHLFADTVRENIRYGRLEASDAEVEEAARLANADSFIQHLPQGYDTPLSEAAGNLSQGQRQLLAIARALLADPKILILDEATSSVDTRTEVHVQEAMLRLMAGRTSFVIAHRLSTIRQADCILVIDGGQVVERGTHAELMARQGAYYQLHQSQFAA
ncbi:MAG: ABC transporter ATP-binding protein [Armatimonadetes bacterium]|nr:ABC transporter ATP-binding protein [Armatimonadota bacterium]